MIRTFVVLTVVVVLTTLVGTMLMTVGMLLPARWCFNPAFHFWSWAIVRAAGVELEIDGGEHLRDGVTYFFAGNHQSAMDIPAMVVVTRGRVRFMAKKNLFYIPFLGWSIWLHGFVPVDRSRARKVKKEVDAMLRRLAARPASMLVFPEGTRSADGQVGPFKRGALQICQRVGMPVVPFAIDGSLAVHRRGSLRVRSGTIRIGLAPPISSEDVERMDTNSLVRRVREEVLRLMAEARSVDGSRRGSCDAAAECGASS